MLLSYYWQTFLGLTSLRSRLQTDYYVSSDLGFNSVSTLITGTEAAVLIDPSFFLTDARECATWIKTKIGAKELSAIFVTHHHPVIPRQCETDFKDHYFGANAILESFPNARLYATPETLAAIHNEIEDKIPHWREVFGPERIALQPQIPEPFQHTFFTLKGDETNPIHLLAPLQGDTIDHTIFWLPKERVLITGNII